MRKACLILTIVIGVAACQKGPDPAKSGSFSSYLSLSLQLEPRQGGPNSDMIVTLANVSKKNLKIHVNHPLFDGAIYITAKNGKTYELYHYRYVPLLQVSVLDAPVVSLKKTAAMSWRLPFRDLCSMHNETVDWKTVAGGSARVALKNVAVEAPGPNVIVDNAMQTTPLVPLPEGAQP